MIDWSIADRSATEVPHTFVRSLEWQCHCVRGGDSESKCENEYESNESLGLLSETQSEKKCRVDQKWKKKNIFEILEFPWNH